MGFDNDCIQNIQSLAGEYFCPVCRLLVHPDEAMLTKCAHLYCKSCLACVISTTCTCPSDGYAVVQSDIKPLREANKALAETIGQIPVNCLYHMSGCRWKGTLAETTAHCSGCTFGNFPVMCNSCGMQIVHRQVQEHTQICLGRQPLAQQVVDPIVAAGHNQTATQARVRTSQSLLSQTAAALVAGQGQNQGTLDAHPQSMPQVVSIPVQWCQQQQQYPGYNPSQQQLQAHLKQMIEGPSHFLLQPQAQVQPLTQAPPPQGQMQAQPQPLSQYLFQPQSPYESYAQTQDPHSQTQMGARPHVLGQVPQQQLHAPVQPCPQMQPQIPHSHLQIGHPHPQAQNYLHPHPHHCQMPQPLANTQIHHPQLQSHLHPQPCPQSHPQPQAHPQPHPQPQPQLQPPPPPHPQPQAQLQLQHLFVQPAMGQLCLQSQPQKPITPYHPLHMQPRCHGSSNGMAQPVQVESQFPLQQKSQTSHPLHSHVPLQHTEQMVLLPMTGQHPHIPLVQQSLSIHHAGQQIHQRPGTLLPLQRPMLQQFPQQHALSPVHQSQLFSGQVPGLVPDQQHQQRPLAPVQPIQPEKSLCPQSLPSSHQQSHFHPWNVSEFRQLRLEKMSPARSLGWESSDLPSSGLGTSSCQLRLEKMSPARSPGWESSDLPSSGLGNSSGQLRLEKMSPARRPGWESSDLPSSGLGSSHQLQLEKMSPARSLGWESSDLP